MEVIFKYSKIQFDDAVKFISINNKNFHGKVKYIQDSILDAMRNVAGKFPETSWESTMGFTVYSEFLADEDLDNNNNLVFITILVDPSLKKDDAFISDNMISNTLIIN